MNADVRVAGAFLTIANMIDAHSKVHIMPNYNLQMNG